MSGHLPQLLDRKTLAAELDVPRSTIDAIFRQLPVVSFADHRKVYVRRVDVENLITQSIFINDGTRVRK